MNHRFLCLLIAGALLSSVTTLQASAEQAVQCEASDTQKVWLARINDARAQPRQCGDKRFEAVKPLSWNCKLEAAAKAHSSNMAENDFFSHTDPDGDRVGQRVTAEGYTWRRVGENIAAGQKSGDAVIEGWLESAGHCANIMKKTFTDMGMSRVEAPDSRYSPYWTQVFGRPR
ncbi:CAP domain-containing protein [Halomonas sp. PR-M31]|uniref:CAP domain-containing protein n=1 Tax=Halomonas sp. PR-M31 TaxID=1471202 RepID=UPI0006511BA9|nr:CAP domain-containing protein [Halomonas sp. PR-M31]